MFLKDSAISIGLNKDIIFYLNKIRQVAIDNDLVLLESNINNDNLYQVNRKSNSTYHRNVAIYKGHYTGRPKWKSHAAYYQTADIGRNSDKVRFFTRHGVTHLRN